MRDQSSESKLRTNTPSRHARDGTCCEIRLEHLIVLIKIVNMLVLALISDRCNQAKLVGNICVDT